MTILTPTSREPATLLLFIPVEFEKPKFHLILIGFP